MHFPLVLFKIKAYPSPPSWLNPRVIPGGEIPSTSQSSATQAVPELTLLPRVSVQAGQFFPMANGSQLTEDALGVKSWSSSSHTESTAQLRAVTAALPAL